MRKHFLFLAAVLFAAYTYAAPIDPARAINVAEQFIPAPHVASVPGKAQAPAQHTPEIVYTHYMPKSGKPAIYVINIGDAFALVSADDVAHPILGYNYIKSWPTDGAALPPSVKGFFDDLAAQMEAASEHPQDAETAAEWQQPRKAPRHAKKNDNLPDSVGPLLTTTWDQGQYYNALCPEDGQSMYDGRCLTGCVATAMAQIIKYWGDKQEIKTRGIHSYESPYGILEVDFNNTSYDFANMPDVLTAESTPEQINEVAKLMYECGVAVNMWYGPTESGAELEVIAPALVDYYSMNTNLGCTNSKLYSGEEWVDLLMANIKENQPILYADASLSHVYILDGYNYVGDFHINWGWGGNYDGWYMLDTLYSYDAVVGVYPDSLQNTIIGQSYGYSSYLVDDVINFKHIYGETKYPHLLYAGGASSQIITFQVQDSTEHVVIDFLSYDDELETLHMMFYDGGSTSCPLIRTLSSYDMCDLSPIETSGHQITIFYTCVKADGGFNLRISKMCDCRMVSDIITLEDPNTKEISWSENGNATQWIVEYGVEGQDGSNCISIVVDTPRVIIDGLSADSTYEVKIRPVCSDDKQYLWNKIILNHRKYWTDVVWSEPDGYKLDSEGCIRISSAEGLAWMAKLRTNNLEGYEYSLKKVIFENDIDMSEYLWRPIQLWDGNIDGQGHVIYNLTIKEISSIHSGGLFSSIGCDTIQNLGFINANINALNPATIAHETGAVIINCYSINHTITASSFNAAGLVSHGTPKIINCFSSGNISLAWSGGGIIGDGTPQMYNCYSSLRKFEGAGWKGLVSGYTRGGFFENCFADVDYIKDTWSEPYVGTLYDNSCIGYFFGYPENTILTRNVAGFTKANNSIAHTIPNMALDYMYEDSIDLVTALNQWVVNYNSSSLRTWVWDSISGLPIFGEFYEPICQDVSDVHIANIPYENNYAVSISWKENGSASQWEIKCLPANVIDEDSAIYYISNNIKDTLVGLSLGKKYDIYIRPSCEDASVGWGKPYSFMVDKPYWIDIVKSCPEGYKEDILGNITISTAEGLAWLLVYAQNYSRLNGYPINNRYISIENDIDMGPYKWSPIALEKVSFYGNGHVIRHLYSMEEADDVGFIQYANYTNIYDLTIADSYFSGKNYVGALLGHATSCEINNCSLINDTIKGHQYVGGVCGILFGEVECRNTSSSCFIYGDQSVGGIIGNPQFGAVINCYSTSNIHIANKLLTKEGIGGLSGYTSGIISNCYSAGNVEKANNIAYNSIGIVLGGADVERSILNNIYGLNQEGLNLIGYLLERETTFINDTISFTSIGNFDKEIIIQGTSYTDLLSALNAWVDANNEDGKYRHWVADTENVNGGFPIFDPNENHNDTPTSIENASGDNDVLPTRKLLLNNQILILRGDKVYTITGQEVR